MKVVRVHNPSGLMATKTKGQKTMATRKRKATTGRRRSNTRRRATTTTNPRRRRHARRRSNPTGYRRRRRSVTANPHRRRHSRRRNPSAANIGQIFKSMVYGAGGAILTRVGSSVAMGFVPSALTSSSFAEPALQAVIAVTAVRWAGKKFLGPQQGDTMMLGGLISAGLSAADKFLPNIQGQLTSIVRAPVQVAPTAAIPLVGDGGGAPNMGDVYDVPGFAGMADVEDIDTGMFNTY